MTDGVVDVASNHGGNSAVSIGSGELGKDEFLHNSADVNCHLSVTYFCCHARCMACHDYLEAQHMAQLLLLLQEEVLERSRMALKQGMRKLNRAFIQSKSNHLLYLALFVVGIFFLVYFWSKVYRTIRWFV